MRAKLRVISGMVVYPSKANFLYVELPPLISGKQLRDSTARQTWHHGARVQQQDRLVGAEPAASGTDK
jgi:histidinol-phosphate/aromatic aminotransferase/cobyric acid decarboxylase-like protein